MNGLTIGQFVERTGVAEGTLRMWERRHGFPTPLRLPSGHRRYSQADLELVRRVASERAAGMSLAAAVARARTLSAPPPSVYAGLRRSRPDLQPRPLRKPMMIALTHAIEDESLLRAERPVLFGSFQTERFYRQEQERWRELSRGAELALAFADFDRVRVPRGGPIEIPVGRDHPLAREWTVVCCAGEYAVCLAAWEPPRTPNGSRADRVFETVWSVEPDIAWEAARICAGIAASQRPGLTEALRPRLESDHGLLTQEHLRLATAVTNRMLSYLS